jgi:putative transposase
VSRAWPGFVAAAFQPAGNATSDRERDRRDGKQYPTWGGKKIVATLHERHPSWELPAVSTANDVVKRHGLVAPRRRRRPVGHPGYQPRAAAAPNDIWTTDFKGQFRTADARWCYPLTIVDAFSRYVIACRGMVAPTTSDTIAVFRRAFQTYGMPAVIRSDNGEPFAAMSLARLSRLSVWWIRLGITPELIDPASPQQNGAHERMHRTLKAETTRPVAANLAVQQRRLTRFRTIYNDVRPHEALGQQPPLQVYRPSSRAFPERLVQLEYTGHYEIRRVSSCGGIRWKSRAISISTVLRREDIGFEPIADGEWESTSGRFGSDALTNVVTASIRSVCGNVDEARRVEAAGPVDAQNAPTRSLQNAKNAFRTAPTRFILVMESNKLVTYVAGQICYLGRRPVRSPTRTTVGRLPSVPRRNRPPRFGGGDWSETCATSARADVVASACTLRPSPD